MKQIFFLALIAAGLCACDDAPTNGSSSGSVDQARRRGILVAQYDVPPSSKLGQYTLVEAWIERSSEGNETRLVIRLKGPHVDHQPRVEVTGLDYMEDYRHIWSEPGGSPYEVWAAPMPPSNPLVLTREGTEVKLHLK